MSFELPQGRLVAYFQPQYNTVTNRIVGAEALARLVTPEGRLLYPGDFLPELEKASAVCQLDWEMVRLACETLAELQKAGTPLPIAVNFSRRHVREKDFLPRLDGILAEFGLPHELLEVEITESALVDESDRILPWLKAVRDQGYPLAIDDFGSGLSSLQFVKDMPVNILKIDRSLLSRNCEDERERVVLESIFTFAHRLNMSTIAEGVETPEQLGFLRTCSCEKIQGYYYSRPIPKEDFLRLCAASEKAEAEEDILRQQAPAAAVQLLVDAVFVKFPLVIFANLTRNSFYMMAYENFTSTECPSTGVFDELIVHGTASMHPEDREAFAGTFDRQNLLAAHARGEQTVSLVTRQMGDDGVYRRVETTDVFVRHPNSQDVLAISLCSNLE